MNLDKIKTQISKLKNMVFASDLIEKSTDKGTIYFDPATDNVFVVDADGLYVPAADGVYTIEATESTEIEVLTVKDGKKEAKTETETETVVDEEMTEVTVEPKENLIVTYDDGRTEAYDYLPFELVKYIKQLIGKQTVETVTEPEVEETVETEMEKVELDFVSEKPTPTSKSSKYEWTKIKM